jgi:hypothetical protein
MSERDNLFVNVTGCASARQSSSVSSCVQLLISLHPAFNAAERRTQTSLPTLHGKGAE